eukprot:scaffold50386_cov65-Phaeocystis_antarctica.AAC.4
MAPTRRLFIEHAYLIYCRGAFGSPSPAGLTACMALPPRQPTPPSPDRREDLPGRFAVGNAQHTNERSRDCQIGMHSRCAVLGWHHLCVERHIAEPKWRLRCAEDLVSRRSGGTRGAMPMGWWESLCGELAHHIREECRTSREL